MMIVLLAKRTQISQDINNVQTTCGIEDVFVLMSPLIIPSISYKILLLLLS